MRLARLLLASTFLAGLLLVATSTPASACSCLSKPLKRLVATATTAFVGDVVEERPLEEVLEVVTVEVESVYAGEVQERTELLIVDDDGCRTGLDKGDRVLAFTFEYPGEPPGDEYADCFSIVDGKTSDEGVVAAAMERLGPGSPPLPGTREVTDLPVPADRQGPPYLLLVGGGLAVVLGGVLVWSLRRGRET